MKPLSLSPVSWAPVRDSKQAREVRWALSLAICSLTLARSYSFSRTRSLSRPLACSLALALALALALTRGVSAPRHPSGATVAVPQSPIPGLIPVPCAPAVHTRTNTLALARSPALSCSLARARTNTGPCYFAVTTDAIAIGRWLQLRERKAGDEEE